MGKANSPKFLDINHEVVKTLADHTSIASDKLNGDTTLGDLGLDSLDMVEAIMDLEEMFDVYVTDEEAGDFRTIGDISRSIYVKIAKEQGDPELA